MKKTNLKALMVLSLCLFNAKSNGQCFSPPDDCLPLNITPVKPTICSGSSFLYIPSITGSSTLVIQDYSWSLVSGPGPLPLPSSGTGAPPPATLAPTGTTTYDLTINSLGPNEVQNGDFSMGNSCFISMYNYAPMVMTPNLYTVTTDVSLVETYTGYGMSVYDHTGPAGIGQMLVANGASTPIVVWEERLSLNCKANYLFSFWELNWTSGPPQANLRVLINGVPHGPFTNTTWDVWNNYQFLVSLSGPVDIKIIDLQTGTWNNNFALDDISLQRVSSTTQSITVTVNPSPSVDCFSVGEETIGTTPYYIVSASPAGALLTYQYYDAYPCGTYPALSTTVYQTTVTSGTTYVPWTDPMSGYITFGTGCAGGTWGIEFMTITNADGSCPTTVDCGQTFRKAGNSGTQSQLQNAELSIIPNPNNGTFTLNGDISGQKTSKEVMVEVVDMLGKSVYNNVAPVSNGGINTTITLGSGVTNGVYMIRVKNNESNQVLRFTLDR